MKLVLFLLASLTSAYGGLSEAFNSFSQDQPSYVQEVLDATQLKEEKSAAVETKIPGYLEENDMDDLVGRSRWCRSRDGECRTKAALPNCENFESPYGRPYCMGKTRRCCYPGTLTGTTAVPTTTTITTITTAINTTPPPTECPEGTIFFAPSNQCFWVLADQRREFDKAQAACSKLGLQLAHPSDPISLRAYLITEYGLETPVWLDACGDGKNFVWLDNGESISNYSPLWYPGEPGDHVTTDFCLLLLTSIGAWEASPNQPYYTYNRSADWYTLCEYRQ